MTHQSQDTKSQLISEVLGERLIAAKSELKTQQEQLCMLRRQPVLVRDDELVSSISHTVGYLNAAIYETELFLNLNSMSEEEIRKYIEKKSRVEKENSEMLEKFLSERSNGNRSNGENPKTTAGTGDKLTAENWTKFTKQIPIAAPKDLIYQAFATREGLEEWFLRSAIFTRPDGNIREAGDPIQKGDAYSWLWHGWSDDVNEKGEVLEANGVDMIKFTFHDPMVVTIEIVEEEDIRLVRLTQENIPTDENSKTNYFVGCGEGWTFYLANLKSLFESGFDLRNKNERIRGVVNS